jgi:hypothetical protein
MTDITIYARTVQYQKLHTVTALYLYLHMVYGASIKKLILYYGVGRILKYGNTTLNTEIYSLDTVGDVPVEGLTLRWCDSLRERLQKTLVRVDTVFSTQLHYGDWRKIIAPPRAYRASIWTESSCLLVILQSHLPPKSCSLLQDPVLKQREIVNTTKGFTLRKCSTFWSVMSAQLEQNLRSKKLLTYVQLLMNATDRPALLKVNAKLPIVPLALWSMLVMNNYIFSLITTLNTTSLVIGKWRLTTWRATY